MDSPLDFCRVALNATKMRKKAQKIFNLLKLYILKSEIELIDALNKLKNPDK